jgi:hypothetical protein
MDKQETYDILNDLHETYQYLMTKLDNTRELLDGASDPLVDFEKQKVMDVVESIIQRHDEIEKDMQQLKVLSEG